MEPIGSGSKLKGTTVMENISPNLNDNFKIHVQDEPDRLTFGFGDPMGICMGVWSKAEM